MSFGENVTKNTSKNLIGKYNQKRFDHAKKFATNAPKTDSKTTSKKKQKNKKNKKKQQTNKKKTAEATGNLIGNKIKIAESIYKDKNNNKFQNKLVKAFRNMHLQYYIAIHKIS